MPNWCENYITFMSNGTPEGNLALQDFHNKIINTPKYNGRIWESIIESYCFDQCNGLFEYQNKIPTYKRGYVVNISDINFDIFHVTTYDAWVANNAFWYYLIKRLYGNNDLITFTFMATEPGMELYYTNDLGVLPRYNLDVFAENGMEDLMKIPAAWDYSNSESLFMFLNNENPFVNRYRPYNNMNKYAFGFYLSSEGDEDDIISNCEEYIFDKDMPDITNIEQLTNKIKDMGLNASMNEFEYVDLEDELKNDIATSCVVKMATDANKNNNDIVEEINDKIKKVSDELGIYIEPLLKKDGD